MSAEGLRRRLAEHGLVLQREATELVESVPRRDGRHGRRVVVDVAEGLPHAAQPFVQEIPLGAFLMDISKRVAQRPLADTDGMAQCGDRDRVVQVAPQHVFGFEHDPHSRGNKSTVVISTHGQAIASDGAGAELAGASQQALQVRERATSVPDDVRQVSDGKAVGRRIDAADRCATTSGSQRALTTHTTYRGNTCSRAAFAGVTGPVAVFSPDLPLLHSVGERNPAD
jgi:hypothetical protein